MLNKREETFRHGTHPPVVRGRLRLGTTTFAGPEAFEELEALEPRLAAALAAEQPGSGGLEGLDCRVSILVRCQEPLVAP